MADEIVGMTMARASDKEIKQAIILAGVIEDVERGDYPRRIDGEYKEGDPEHFDEDDIEHWRALGERLSQLSRGLFRVTFGFSTLMNPANELVDLDMDSLTLHPRLIKALEREKKLIILMK